MGARLYGQLIEMVDCVSDMQKRMWRVSLELELSSRIH